MLTTKNWAFLLSLVIAMAFCVGCQEPGPRALLEGEALIKAGKFSDALPKLQAAVELLPQNAQAWNHLGLAAHGAQQPDAAAKAYQKALTLDRNLAAARFNLGSLFLEQGNYPAAVTELTTYTVLQPNQPQGWVSLGAALLRARRLDDAERAYVHADKLLPNSPEVLNGLGMVQIQKRKIREAAQFFTNALHVQPRYSPALLNLAVVAHRSLNNRQYALQRYKEYLTLEPNSANSLPVEEIIRQIEIDLQPKPAPPRQTNQVSAPSIRSNVVSVAPEPKPAPTSNPPPTVVRPATNRFSEVPSAKPPEKTNVVSSPAPAPAPAVVLTNVAVRDVKPPPLTNEPPPVKLESVRITEDFTVKPAQDVPVPKATQAVVVANIATPPRTNAPPPEAARPSEPLINPVRREAKPGILQRINPVVDKLNPATWFKSREKESPPSTQATAAPPPTTNTARAAAIPAVTSAPPPTAPELPPIPRYSYLSPRRPSPGNKTEAASELEAGLAAHQGRRFEEAMTRYKEAARRDPASFESYYNMALAAYQAKKLPEALFASEHALAINPDSADARFNFALSLQNANYPLDAAIELERVLRSEPDKTAAHLAVANLYAQRLQQPTLAKTHYQRVLELDPRHPLSDPIRAWIAAH